MVRVEAANFQRGIPLPGHPDNADEARYPSRFASYSKGLPHDGLGDVNTQEYDKLLVAISSGNPADFEAITLGGTRMLVNPQSAYAYQLEGADSHALAIAPAPTFAGLEIAGEMEELYWMALARDVSFQDYAASTPVIPDALQRLNQLGVFRGPRENGQVTAQTLFRDSLPGSTVGPFISQFLLLDVPYGAQTVSQRIRTRVAGDDRVSAFDEWLRIQNGQSPAQGETFDATPRYLRNGRDLAEFVHHDFPLHTTRRPAGGPPWRRLTACWATRPRCSPTAKCWWWEETGTPRSPGSSTPRRTAGPRLPPQTNRWVSTRRCCWRTARCWWAEAHSPGSMSPKARPGSGAKPRSCAARTTP
ncbi:MAG TPA: hypothetical protein VF697_23110 [Archangium sp.]|jgi:hypothetical protein